MQVCISYQDTVNAALEQDYLRRNFFLLYYYKVRVRRVAAKVTPTKALQEVRGNNPPVTALPCQPPLGKRAMGTGGRIATASVRTGFAMTWFFARGAVRGRRRGEGILPYGEVASSAIGRADRGVRPCGEAA